MDNPLFGSTFPWVLYENGTANQHPGATARQVDPDAFQQVKDLYQLTPHCPSFDKLGGEYGDNDAGVQAFLEMPHDYCHGYVGGDMGDPRTASLDPIFFFHHNNVERLFWEWQNAHPDQQFPADDTLAFFTGSSADQTTVNYSFDTTPPDSKPSFRPLMTFRSADDVIEHPVVKKNLFQVQVPKAVVNDSNFQLVVKNNAGDLITKARSFFNAAAECKNCDRFKSVNLNFVAALEATDMQLSLTQNGVDVPLGNVILEPKLLNSFLFRVTGEVHGFVVE